MSPAQRPADQPAAPTRLNPGIYLDGNQQHLSNTPLFTKVSYRPGSTIASRNAALIQADV